MKGKGSDAGHNGLKNINEVLQTQNYARLRFGISADFAAGRQVDYVLGTWNEEETEKLTERIETFSKQAFPLFLQESTIQCLHLTGNN
jgi:PTH1 family peptidyl-tRNA hydrolase